MASRDFDLTISEDEISNIETSLNLVDEIEKPIRKGQILGYISYSIEGHIIDKIPLLAAEELLVPDKKSNPILRWLLRLFLAYIIWRTIVVYSRYRKKKRRKIKEAPTLFMNRKRGRIW